MMDAYYNKHYIRLREDRCIIEGWSNGPHNQRTPTEEDILLNDKGGYQFRLIVDGQATEENPPLYEIPGMIPLYRWSGSEVIRRSEDELAADRAAYQAAQQKQARLAELHRLLESTDYIAAKIAEGAATREEYADKLAQRQAWRTEINDLESEASND